MLLRKAGLLVVGLLFWSSSAAAAGRAKAPRFYFEVRTVKVPVGSSATLKDRAKALLITELRKQPTVVLELGEPAPKAAERESALKARKLDGYSLVLRVVKSSHVLQPPAAGKVYKMLMVDVEVAIDAEKIPSGQMALAGEGSSQVGTEVKAVKEQEKQQLLGEALTEAIKQAVAKSISKLGGFKAGGPPPSRRKKR